MLKIKRIEQPDALLLPALVALLQDVVHDGASVGFLAPLSEELAAAYWQQVFASLSKDHALWLAYWQGQVVGSVQLDRCTKANGKHRAELQKLFVLTTFRGRGISSALLNVAEQSARDGGVSLLVLDTLSGTFAETVYRHHGWQFAGSIPDFAATPDGVLHATSYYYKRL